MKTTLLLTTLAAATVMAGRAQDIAGNWQGTLKPAPGAQLHLLIHISKTTDGSLKATMDSLDQDALGKAATRVATVGAVLGTRVTYNEK